MWIVCFPVERLCDGTAGWTGNCGHQRVGDVKTIVIPSQGSLEYKVAVEEGRVFEYEWMTPGTELFFDFHGEEFDAAPDEFTSFKVATDSRSSGFLTTPFTGRAGWYWRNEGDEATVITL